MSSEVNWTKKMSKKVKAVRYCILANYNNREKEIEFNVIFFKKNSEFWPSGVLMGQRVE